MKKLEIDIISDVVCPWRTGSRNIFSVINSLMQDKE